MSEWVSVQHMPTLRSCEDPFDNIAVYHVDIFLCFSCCNIVPHSCSINTDRARTTGLLEIPRFVFGDLTFIEFDFLVLRWALFVETDRDFGTNHFVCFAVQNQKWSIKLFHLGTNVCCSCLYNNDHVLSWETRWKTKKEKRKREEYTYQHFSCRCQSHFPTGNIGCHVNE